MGKVLAIVNRAISTNLINKAGFKVTEAHTGAVTLIQRFGSALNLNLHFHALFIDGVFSPKSLVPFSLLAGSLKKKDHRCFATSASLEWPGLFTKPMMHDHHNVRTKNYLVRALTVSDTVC